MARPLPFLGSWSGRTPSRAGTTSSDAPTLGRKCQKRCNIARLLVEELEPRLLLAGPEWMPVGPVGGGCLARAGTGKHSY